MVKITHTHKKNAKPICSGDSIVKNDDKNDHYNADVRWTEENITQIITQNLSSLTYTTHTIYSICKYLVLVFHIQFIITIIYYFSLINNV